MGPVLKLLRHENGACARREAARFGKFALRCALACSVAIGCAGLAILALWVVAASSMFASYKILGVAASGQKAEILYVERPAAMTTEWIVDLGHLIDGPDRAGSFGFFEDAISEKGALAYVSAEKAEKIAIKLRASATADPVIEERKQAVLKLFTSAQRQSFGARDYGGRVWSCLNPFHREVEDADRAVCRTKFTLAGSFAVSAVLFFALAIGGGAFVLCMVEGTMEWLDGLEREAAKRSEEIAASEEAMGIGRSCARPVSGAGGSGKGQGQRL